MKSLNCINGLLWHARVVHIPIQLRLVPTLRSFLDLQLSGLHGQFAEGPPAHHLSLNLFLVQEHINFSLDSVTSVKFVFVMRLLQTVRTEQIDRVSRLRHLIHLLDSRLLKNIGLLQRHSSFTKWCSLLLRSFNTRQLLFSFWNIITNCYQPEGLLIIVIGLALTLNSNINAISKG